jgi:uncharacterized phage-associated protein
MFNIFKKYNDINIRKNTNLYDAMDVAAYIINYCDEKGTPIENMRVQKYLYLLQAYFLVETKEQKPLFGEYIEAWKFGPVVPVVYYSLNRYGYNKITNFKQYNNIMSVNPVEYKKHIIAKRDQEIIKKVINQYENLTLSELIEITQSHDPWSKAYGFFGNNSDKIIPLNSIIDFFKKNRVFV